MRKKKWMALLPPLIPIFCFLVTLLMPPVVSSPALTRAYGVGATLSTESHALSKAQMYEDYDDFWQDLKENYPYMTAASRINNKDYSKIQSSYRKKIADVTNDSEFFDLMSDCADTFDFCGHLHVLGKEEYQYDLSTYSQNLKYPHISFLYSTLTNRASQRFYGTLSSTTSANSISSNVTSGSQTLLDQLTMSVLEENKIVYLAIPSFGAEHLTFDGPLLENFFQKYADYPYLIIDIRGNGGGTSQYWQNYLVDPNLTQNVSYKTYSLVRGDRSFQYMSTCTTMVNRFQLPFWNMSNLNWSDFDTMNYLEIRTNSYTAAKSPVFKGKIYVLIDETNYSAAEAFAYFCKTTGFATLVGTSTGGDGLGIDPMSSVLPNSGIVYCYTPSMGLNPDGSCNEEEGTAPDIPNEKGKDALATCLKVLK